jgi:DNA-binding beta-propeller fold protein YncE
MTVGTGLLARNAWAGERENDRVVIGDGAHRYAVDHEWATLPTPHRFGYTHGIVEDRSGRIFIANQGSEAIMVFDAEGNFLSAWGEEYAPGAHGLNIATEGGEEVLYLANTGLAQVVKTTLDGEVIWKRGTPERPDIYNEEKTYSPTETAIAPDGTVYVADGYGQSWIHVYSSEGQYLDAFGGPGEAPGNLHTPHGINIDSRGSRPVLQIADRSNVRIVNFSLAGDFLGEIVTSDDLRYPCSTVHAGGKMYVPDLFARVSIFNANNEKIIDLGDYVDGASLTDWDDFGTTFPELEGYPNIPHERRIAGKFVSPHDLWVDGEENIYLVEWIEDGRVTKLIRQ